MIRARKLERLRIALFMKQPFCVMWDYLIPALAREWRLQPGLVQAFASPLCLHGLV